jgi:DNA-directed RNA polymerase II subunit RPB1
MSVVPVFSDTSFEGGKIVPNGLFDLRMGSLEKDVKCMTCESYETCPGHFGHIKLAVPVYHQGLMDMLTDVLKCVCFHCSRLLVDKSDPRYQKILKMQDPEKRIKAIIKLAERKKRCVFKDDFCGQPRAIIHHVETLRINIEFTEPCENYEEGNFRLTAKMARRILKKISVEDYEALCFERSVCEPASLTLRYLLVAPPAVRPSNKSNSIVRGEDDSTKKYVEILRVNNNLTNAIQKKKDGQQTMKVKGVERPIDQFISDYSSMLECRVAELFDSSSVSNQTSSGNKVGKQMKGFVQKIKGKGGRVRSNLMGKRVDFSARTVITPDPNISIDEVGMPRSIADTLTFPETVNHLNIERLEAAVKAGPSAKEGANYVILPNGYKLNLSVKDAYDTIQKKFGGLQYGMKVETHLRDGQYVIFNRQPSLHRLSIMGHRVRIMPYSTFRMNPSATGPYNADFDGDEMNGKK